MTYSKRVAKGAVLVFSLLACGSTTIVDPMNQPGTGGEAASGGGGRGDASSSSSSGAGGTMDLDCSEVPELIDNLLQAAASCAPSDPVPHCQDIVDGYCCPVPVESISAPSTQAYLDFLELTKAKCPALWEECEDIDCAFPEDVSCVEDPDEPGVGHCTAQ